MLNIRTVHFLSMDALLYMMDYIQSLTDKRETQEFPQNVLLVRTSLQCLTGSLTPVGQA